MTSAEELVEQDARERLRNSVQSPRVQRFVRNMRVLREQKGLSTAQLADLLDEAVPLVEGAPRVTRSILINLENFRRSTVTIDEGLLIAEVLQTTLGWLCDFDGPACSHCLDNPPEGYACKVCLADTDVRFKPHVELKEEQGA